MKKRLLGKSGLLASEIGVGCWAIGGADWNLNMEMGWGGTDKKKSIAGLKRAFELGGNCFDTADIYGHGYSERLIGEFLKSVPRDKVIIGSKVGYFSGTGINAYHPLNLRHQLEMSLNNIGTDYLDIYYFHNYNFGENDEYLEGAIETMRRFQEEGKIRVIGQRGPHTYAPYRKYEIGESENKYKRFLRIAKLIGPAIIQVRYNILSPTFDNYENDIFNWAEINNVGVIINKPLAQGLLLDKYDPKNPPCFEVGDHRSRKKWFKSESLEILKKRLSLLKSRFGNNTEDLVRVALQYCLSRSPIACVVVGFKNPEQVEMNMKASAKYLTEDDIQYIRKVMSGVNEEVGSFFEKGK